MTIRMLHSFNGLFTGELVTDLTSEEESRLVGLGLATRAISGDTSDVPPAPRSRVAYSVAEIQDAHDELVSLGGGALHFVPQADYVWKSTDPSINIDSTYVDLYFNRSRHNLTACADGFEAFKFASTVVGNQNTFAQRCIYDPWIFTDNDGALADSGPIAFRFDATTASTSNRLQIHRARLKGLKRGISLGSRSYFVRMYNPHITRCRHALYQSSSPSDFAEMVTAEGGVFDDNYSHLTDVGGQIWRFKTCSFDYHTGYLFDLSAGAKVFGDDVHGEWSYGEDVADTNSPIRLQGANCGVQLDGGSVLAYVGAGQNPYYTSLVSANNSSQKVILKLAKASKLGRLTDTTGYDALVATSGGVSCKVDFEVQADGTAVSDVPTMTLVAEGGGVIGQLRNGEDDIYNELVHRIAVTGSAAVSRVTADENGVTRKNSKNMLKITGVGKVLIAFPQTDGSRRHAWSLFTNPAFVTGSVTIKERQTGFSPKFDGTTVTWAADTRGAQYSATTVTVSAGANAWTRQSWKSCNTVFYPSQRQNVSGAILIEIDTASMSAGALYLSHAGFDLL